MDFKSLKQLLKPEIMANLEEGKEKYPNSYKSIMDKLSECVIVGQLDFSTIVTLTSYSPKPVNTIMDIYNMFDEN